MQLVDNNNQMIENRLSIDLINGINPKHVKEDSNLIIDNEDINGYEVAFLTWKPSKFRIIAKDNKVITIRQEAIKSDPTFEKNPTFKNKDEKEKFDNFLEKLKAKATETKVEFSLNGKEWSDHIIVTFDDLHKKDKEFYADILIRGKYQPENLHQGASPYRPDIKIFVEGIEEQEPLYVMIRTRRNANELCDQAIEQYTSAFYALNTHQVAEKNKLKFIGAGKGIYCTDFVEMHVKAAETSAHNDTHFLPWHRMYLLDVERHLQMYNPFVTLNYWKFDQVAPRLFTEHFIGETQITDGVDGKQHEIAYFDQGGSSTNLAKFSNTNPLRAWTLNGRLGIQREARFNPIVEAPIGLPGGLRHYDDEAVFLLGDRLSVPFTKISPEVYGKINEDRQNTEKAYFIQQLGKYLDYSSRLNQVIVEKIGNINSDKVIDIDAIKSEVNTKIAQIKVEFEEIKQEDCNIIFSYVDNVVVRVESIINDQEINNIEILKSRLKELIDSLYSNYEIFESIKIYPQLITSYNRMHKFITQDGDLRPETFSEFVRRELIFQREISVNSFEVMEIFTHSSAHVSFNGYLNMVPIAPQDPIFFLLHTNVDRQWAEWQKRKGTYMVSDPASYPYQLPECLLFDEPQINTDLTHVDEWKTVDAPLWPWHDVAAHPGNKLPPGTRKRNFAHSKFGKNFEHNVPHIYDAINGFGYPYNSTNGIVVHEDYLGFEYDSIDFLKDQKGEVDLKRVKFLKLNEAANELVKRYQINTDTAGVFNFAGSIFSIYGRHPLIKNYDDLIEIMLEEIITFKLNDTTEFEFIDNIANNSDFKKLTSAEFEELAKDKAGLLKIKKSLNSEIKGYIELVSASTIFLELNPKVYRQFQQMLMLLCDDAVQKDLRTIAYSALVNFFEHLPMIARLQDKLDHYVDLIRFKSKVKDLIQDEKFELIDLTLINDYIDLYNSSKDKNLVLDKLFIKLYNDINLIYENLEKKIITELSAEFNSANEDVISPTFILELIKEIIIEKIVAGELILNNKIATTQIFKDSKAQRKDINDLLFSENDELPPHLIINLLGIKYGRLNPTYLQTIIDNSKDILAITSAIKHLSFEEIGNLDNIEAELENVKIDVEAFLKIVNPKEVYSLAEIGAIIERKDKKELFEVLNYLKAKISLQVDRNHQNYIIELNKFTKEFKIYFNLFKDAYNELSTQIITSKYCKEYYKVTLEKSLIAIEQLSKYVQLSEDNNFDLSNDYLLKYTSILNNSIIFIGRYLDKINTALDVINNKKESQNNVLISIKKSK